MYCRIKVFENNHYYYGIPLDTLSEGGGEHVSVYGEILENPFYLPYQKEQWNKWRAHPFRNDFIYKRIHEAHANSINWETTIETKVCDKVWFHFKALNIDCGNNEYYVRYDDLFCVKRDEQIIMLNGFVAIEESPETYSYLGVDIENKFNRGKIAYIGSPLGSYFAYKQKDTDTLKVGHTVIYHKLSAFRMEVDIHNKLGKDVQLVQRRDILGYEL
jgi:co-chaperonin GroES (HSP10)